MLKERARIIAAGVFFTDLALVSLAFIVAHWLRSDVGPRLGLVEGQLHPLASYLPLLPLALGLSAIVLLWSRRYHTQRTVSILAEARKVVGASLLATALLVLAIYLFRLDEQLFDQFKISRIWIGLFAALSSLFLVAFRLALRLASNYLRTQGLNYRTIVIVGANATAMEIVESIERHQHWGLKLLGFISNRYDTGAEIAGRYPVLGNLSDLVRIAEEEVVDEVIFALSPQEIDRAEQLFLTLQDLGICSRFAVDPFPHARSTLEVGELDGVPLLTFSTAPMNPIRLLVKRAIDIVVSATVLLASLPILLAIAIATKLSSPGPVLFRQTRCGLNGRRFTLYKFRTMVADAEERMAQVEHLNEMSGPVFKVRDDPRITPLGRLLRRYSLDELPQLWNVLTGSMSLVGPRPPIPGEVERYERWQRRRLSMRPGLTCLWQVTGRNDVDFDRWMELDLQYIDSWSPLLDLKILARTIPVVLSGRGAS